MPWPLSQDYNEAIQNPKYCFNDAELQQGEAVTNALGLPVPRSGNFADVYEVRCPATATQWAVKCFTREVTGLRERYSEISRHLHAARLPFTVDFRYLADGIRVRGQWYPVLKMQWVEGLLLNEFVRSALEKPAKLEALVLIWARMGRRLRDARLAHADLQHGNVLLVPGSKNTSLGVKLIDYDGMFVPALAKTRSGEVGHPAYQHPQRLREGTYNLEVDRFPLLAVAAALRCLMVGGRPLWDRYDNGDNVLFKEADLRDPAQSALFHELWRLDEPVAHALVGYLALASRGRPEQAPLVSDLLAEGSTPALSYNQEQQLASLLGASGTGGRLRAALPASGATPVVSARPAADFNFGVSDASGPTRPGSKPPRGRIPAWAWAAACIAGLGTAIGLGVGLTARGPGDTNPPHAAVDGSARHGPKQGAVDEAPSTTPGSAKEHRHPPEEHEPAPTKNDSHPHASDPDTEPPPADEATDTSPTPKPNTKPRPRPAPDKSGGKLPVPGADVLATAEEQIKEQYPTAYTDQSPDDMQGLAEKFLRGGLDPKDSPARRFVLLREARDLAARAGDPSLALRAADQLAERFEVNALADKKDAVVLAERSARTAGAHRRVVEAVLTLVEDAKAADDYEAAASLMKVARKAALTAHSSSLHTKVYALGGQIDRLAKEYETLRPVARTLAESPKDPVANLQMARFQCFHKGDWAKGLPMLALGDDAALKELANKDLAAPEGASEQVEVGDSWWEQAKTAKAPDKAHMERRAFHWYTRAVSLLSDSDQTRVEKRIAALAKHLPDLQASWDLLEFPRASVKDGFLRLSPPNRRWLVTRMSYAGPIEVNAVARTNGLNIRLYAGPGGMLIFNWEGGKAGEELRVHRPDDLARGAQGSLASSKPVPLKPDTWYALRWRITENGMAVYVNGLPAFAEVKHYDLTAKWPVKASQAFGSVVDVKSLTVTPLR